MPQTKKYFLVFIACIFTSLFFLIISEFSIRLLLKESPYLPKRQIQIVQCYVRPHPRIGFLCKENIAYSDNVLWAWNDQDVTPLSTDSKGFRNHPNAMVLSGQKRHIDIIGLGDSFLYSSAYLFHEFFLEHNLFYYNMSMFRHCPPQYNYILTDYVLPLKPDWVIYSIYKNDFSETVDFENWEKSCLDWFTYHSGFWAGPAIDNPRSRFEVFVCRHLKGWYAFYRVMRCKYLNLQGRLFNNRNKEKELSEDYQRQIERVKFFILQANNIARANNIKFLLVLIPDKLTMTTRDSNRRLFYDNFLELFKGSDIEILDLYRRFDEIPGTHELYYKNDGHWNSNGIKMAAEAILEVIIGKNN